MHQVSTFATRVRSTQDALADSTEALADAERKLGKAHSAKRDFIQAEQQLEAELADRDKEIELLRGRQADLEASVAKLESDKESILKDHSDSTEAHSTSLETVRAELESLKTAKEQNKDQLEASKTEASTKIAELESLSQRLQESLNTATMDLSEKEGKHRRAHKSLLSTVFATIDSSHLVGKFEYPAECQVQVSQFQEKAAKLTSLQQEFDDYKTRASRVLQVVSLPTPPTLPPFYTRTHVHTHSPPPPPQALLCAWSAHADAHHLVWICDLQSKEKTIEDLRVAAGGTPGDVGSSSVEAIELKRERDALIEEVKDLSGTISQLRLDLQVCEHATLLGRYNAD